MRPRQEQIKNRTVTNSTLPIQMGRIVSHRLLMPRLTKKYWSYSYIIYLVKMEPVTEITIFGLKMV